MIEVFDERTVNAELHDLEGVPDKLPNKPAHQKGAAGKFRPENLHADWRRQGGERWELFYLTVSGQMYTGNGELSIKTGAFDLTFNGEDLEPIAGEPWIIDILTPHHPLGGFDL